MIQCFFPSFHNQRRKDTVAIMPTRCLSKDEMPPADMHAWSVHSPQRKSYTITATQGEHDLKVLIKGKRPSVLTLRLGILSRTRAGLGTLLLVPLCTRHDTRLLVVADALLEEIGLAGEGDALHEVERVRRVVDLVVAEGDEQAVGDELDVLLHEGGVHAEQGARQGVDQELLLDGDGLGDDLLDGGLAGPVAQVREQQAGEVSVQTLVARDELVREGQARHQAPLLEPEDGGEGAAEEDAFDGGKGYESLGEGRVLILDPAYGPVGFLADAGDWGENNQR